jgi:acid phosphatase family membrane protein YuiD
MSWTIVAIAFALVTFGVFIGILVAALCSASNENHIISDLMRQIHDLTAEKERLRCMLGETEQ